MGWKKGQSGNPSGRKRSNWRKAFDAAIEADTEKHAQSIFEYVIELAREDNKVLIAILRKCLPDYLLAVALLEFDGYIKRLQISYFL